MSRCPACGAAALVEDAHYAQAQLVCAACGCVAAEGLLTTTFSDEEHLREVAFTRSTGQREQRSRCVQRGIKRVQDLCRVLRLPRALEETAVALAERALPRAAFRRLGRPRKELLGGCCVLASCRQHGWPLAMGTLCALLYADAELLAGVFRQLRAELQLCVPALGLAELVRTQLNGFRLFQQAADVPAPFVEDKEQLVTRTLQVVELAGDTWLVTGRHPVPIVTAAAFLAWQSLRPAARLACTLARFCRAAGLQVPPPAPLRLKELHDVLLRMAAQLAWLRVLPLDKKTVVKHLGDILQHRIFLLRKAFRAEDEEEEEEEKEMTPLDTAAPVDTTAPLDTVATLDTPAPIDTGAPLDASASWDAVAPLDTAVPLDAAAPQDAAAPLNTGAPRDATAPLDAAAPLDTGAPLGAAGHKQHQVSPSVHTGARGRLLPPCLLRPRKRPRAAAPDAPAPAVTGDEPISDSEIEQYLRGREEARAFGKAKAWL